MSKMVAGRYKIEGELGSGGMGTVYKGLDTETNQTVAIKQLHPKLSDEQLIERFKREGEALRDLNHPNIVKMLDAVEEYNQHYLIMEYVSGSDLSDLIKQEQLALEKILNFSIDLADALTRAHRLNIIHRDLKPANVLIGEDGILRLTDFGVAHIGSKERVTDTDAIVGTIHYLPPEAFDDGTFDGRGDIWAFGVILYELLTGELPFNGAGVVQIFQSIVSDPIPDLEELRPDIPLALIDLTYRMLERNYHVRIPSVRIVGAELEAIAEGRATTTQLTQFDTPPPNFFVRKQHNLPVQPTAFVGRESELDELDKLLADSSQRLITVIAPGGMGKTRLALESAERHLDNFEDGVYFVDLAPLTQADQIVNAIVEATGFSLTTDNRSPEQQLLDFLGNKSMLLIMDNYEHLIDGASLVVSMMQSAPDGQFLVTSRVALNLPGETLFHLSGMDFPQWETPEDAMNYAAVKLFMSSANRASPSFELGVDNLDYIARICRLVGGMPLGIILSASWLSMLSPQEIAEEIASGIDFLESSRGEVPERQRSIQVVFDYSWDLMSTDEQAIYAKLSIFHGGFTRNSAQTISGATLRNLMNLVNRSLIRRDAQTGRYSIHELARQYAYAKLENSGELESLRDAHLEYYANALHEWTPKLKECNEIPVLNEFEADFENVRTAWLYGTESEQWSLLTIMVEPMALFGLMKTREVEIAALFLPVINHLEGSETLTARQEIMLAKLVAHLPRGTRLVSFEEQEILARTGLELARKHHLPLITVHCLELLASAIDASGQFEEAYQLIEEAIQLARDSDDIYVLSWLMQRQTYHSGLAKKHQAWRIYLVESIALARQLNNKTRLMFALRNYIPTLDAFRSLDNARKPVNELKRLAYDIGNLEMIFYTREVELFEAIRKMQLQEAEIIFEELITISRQTNRLVDLATVNSVRFRFAILDGQYELALEAINEAMEQLEKAGQSSPLGGYAHSKARILAVLSHTQDSLKIYRKYIPDLFKFDTRNRLVRGVHCASLMLERRGESLRATELLGLVSLHWDTPEYHHTPYALELKKRLKVSLGEDVYNEAFERGKSLDLKEMTQIIFNELYTIYLDDNKNSESE